jgi:hypothetical protein
MCYWDNTGTYQTIYDRLYKELVPQSGPSAFVEGENLRAINRIYYDYCNNGFGNNLTGAFNWLNEHNLLEKSEIEVLLPYMNCRIAGRSRDQFEPTDPIMITLDKIADRVVEKLMAASNFTPHDDDLFNYSDKDDWFNNDEDEDDYDESEDDDE